MLLSLVLRTLRIVGPSPGRRPIRKVEVIIIGIGISSQGQRNEESRAYPLLVIEDDQLTQKAADEQNDEGEVSLLLEEILRATIHVNDEEHLRRRLTQVEAHLRMVIDAVPFIIVVYLRHPKCSRGHQEDLRVIQENILVYEEYDKAKVNPEVEDKELSLERLRVHHQILVVDLECLLQQPHLEHERVEEVSAARELQEIKAGANVDEDEVLPEEAEVPNDQDGQGEQRELLCCLVVGQYPLELSQASAHSNDEDA